MDAALQWLEDNQDRDLEDIKGAEPQVNVTTEGGASNEEQVARSFVCNECGKAMRNTEVMQFHASKSYVPWSRKFTQLYYTITDLFKLVATLTFHNRPKRSSPWLRKKRRPSWRSWGRRQPREKLHRNSRTRRQQRRMRYAMELHLPPHHGTSQLILPFAENQNEVDARNPTHQGRTWKEGTS